MKHSIAKKLFLLRKEIGSISKDTTNPFYNSKYFDINTLIDQLDPLLEKHGVLLTPPQEDGFQWTILECIDSGETRRSSLELPDEQNPQKLGSCITYYRRYTLSSMLGLKAEDDDGNLASKSTPAKRIKKTLDNSGEVFERAKAHILKGGSIDNITKDFNLTENAKKELLNLNK